MSRSKRHSAVIQQARRQSKESKHKNLHFDSLNSHGLKETSVTPKNANKSASSRNGCSRSSGSASSKSRQASATRRGSSGKRSFHEIRNTQAPGLPSSERANKVRRRKKKETVSHRKSSSKSLADDAYDFHFWMIWRRNAILTESERGKHRYWTVAMSNSRRSHNILALKPIWTHCFLKHRVALEVRLRFMCWGCSYCCYWHSVHDASLCLNVHDFSSSFSCDDDMTLWRAAHHQIHSRGRSLYYLYLDCVLCANLSVL